VIATMTEAESKARLNSIPEWVEFCAALKAAMLDDTPENAARFEAALAAWRAVEKV
jgi:hypothetical protein